jgi:hypothetical protein
MALIKRETKRNLDPGQTWRNGFGALELLCIKARSTRITDWFNVEAHMQR